MRLLATYVDELKEFQGGKCSMRKELSPDIQVAQVKEVRFRTEDMKTFYSVKALTEALGFYPEGISVLGAEVRGGMPTKLPKQPAAPPPQKQLKPEEKPPEKSVPTPEKVKKKKTGAADGAVGAAEAPGKTRKRGRPPKEAREEAITGK